MATTDTLETCDPSGILGLRDELYAIKQAARHGISQSRIGGNDIA
jgi:hypothetical protein